MGELLNAILGSPVMNAGYNAQPLTSKTFGGNGDTSKKGALQLNLTQIESALVASYRKNELPINDHVVNQSDLGLAVYREMLDRDAHVFATTETLLTEACSMPWRIVPAGKDPTSLLLASFVEEMFFRVNFVEETKKLATAALVGFSVCENLFGDGLNFQGKKVIPWAGFKRLPEESIGFLSDGTPIFRTQKNVTGVELPRLKYTWLRYGEGNYGDPVLRHCYAAYFYKRNVQLFWAKYLERWGDPPIFGFHDREEQAAEIENILAEVRSSSYGSLPATLREPLVLNPSQNANFNEAVGFWNDEISRAILSGTRNMSGSDASGAYSATEVHANQTTNRAQSLAKTVARTLNYDLIPTLVMLNYGASCLQYLPYVEFGYEEQENPKDFLERTKLVVDIAKAGGFEFQLSKAELYERGAFSKPLDDTDSLVIVPAAPGFGFGGGVSNFTEGEPTKNWQTVSQEVNSKPGGSLNRLGKRKRSLLQALQNYTGKA